MITRSLLFILLWKLLNIAHGENCSIFERDSASITDDIFEEIKEYANSGAPDELFNITAIESIYSEYLSTKYNEDIDLNITQLLNKYGYPVEQHEVLSSDGYILTMFRIPSDGPVVFVMHGILCSSDDFVTTGPNNGLAYLLADAGYDVWLGNARGNVHSRRHISLSPSCAEFWDFSWDEIGRYDLPAMIDYALDKTNQKQLVYIGHSQGTTTYFVMCSERPEYNDKIKLMIALSAVSFLSHTKSPLLKIFSAIYPFLWANLKALGIYDFMPRNVLLEFLTNTFCGRPATAAIICDSIVFLLMGPDYAQINATALPVIFGHMPAGIATKQLVHYAQIINTGTFRRFDYGKLENLATYGLLSPPDYPVEKITAPMVIFYGLNDWLGPIEDVEKLISKLPNLVKFITVPWDRFSHMDYLLARDVKELLYVDVLNLIKESLNGSLSG
ncbi:lipase 3-like [Galleria mellonella]|uniref:Lipase 3-like n=1 Tax=Galleria mellonella TaxID=7137 RepID=A0A6J1WJC1_GALME|nr:lipase 3-like [Galleria mellonella]